MKTIYLTKGVPASGKSTWAKQEVFRRNGQLKRFNKDDLRTMIDNGVFDLQNEKFIVSVRDKMVEDALSRGYDVVVDDTNFSDKHFYTMCDIAKRVGDVMIVEKFFDVSLKEALQRNSKRENKVEDHIIVNMYEKHVKSKKVETRTVYFEKVKNLYNVDSMLQSKKQAAIIVDLDGTLALNESGRSYYDYTRVDEDSVNYSVLEVVQAIHTTGAKVIIVSGRDSSCKELCELWLNVYGVPYDLIFLREENDKRKDDIVKKEIYERDIEPYFNIITVLDDRDSVVNMWRTLGLSCFQVNHGGF